MPYSLSAQREKEKKAVQTLDNFFGHWYQISKVNRRCERNGIDRIWKCKRTGRRFTVEYKADWTASGTGNIFIETISVDTANKSGWAFTSLAQLLIYYIPPNDKAYLVAMSAIKSKLVEWTVEYPASPPIPNVSEKGEPYNTYGILVPIGDFERECKPRTFIISGKAP